MTSHSTRTFACFVVAVLVLAGACLLRANTAAASTVATIPALAGETATVADKHPGLEQTPLTRALLLASLARDVAAHFNLEGDLQLELLRPWTPPSRVAASWAVQVLEYPNLASTSMLLRCRVLAEGAPVADATFLVRAALWRDAWTTRQPLTAGAVFEPAALETRRVDLLRERDALPASVGDRSYVFSRGVQAGRLLTWRDVARRPLVKKGERVEVSAVDGLLAIRMEAQAMENGAQGDTITVRNLESRKDFAAVVVDESRVQVRF